MLFIFRRLRFLKGDTGKRCPKCGGYNTEDYGPFWYCKDCDYEW